MFVANRPIRLLVLTNGIPCVWASCAQADLLRLLELIGRHFTSAALSIRATRSFDAARLVTMACIATVADVVVRQS